MILKELDPFLGGPDDVAARIPADKLAYCLRRFYRRSTEVDIVNDLSICSGRPPARVDHLVIHSLGFLVIEREDGGGRVRIDDDGQWLQCDGAQNLPMASPITRAYVQALLLKAFLGRRVRQKGFFDHLELDVLVVVSDDCVIEWPPTGPLPEVCVRDQLIQRISTRLLQCRAQASGTGALNAGERRILGEFLRQSHMTPLDGDEQA